MGYTGTVQKVMGSNGFACDNNGNVVMTVLVETFLNGQLVGQAQQTQTFACQCCQYCCCIALDAGGYDFCYAAEEPADSPICQPLDCMESGVCEGGGLGPGLPQCHAPLTRTKSCTNLSSDIGSCTQNKACGSCVCQCCGFPWSGCGPIGKCFDAGPLYTGVCTWISGDNDIFCTPPPTGC